MKVQITNVGVQQIAATGEPLNIVKYVLGSDYGYTPVLDAVGIKGTEVYSSSPTEIEVLNANIYKYQIGLDYNVGNFSFGEVALYDSQDNCVAVGVSEEPISKLKTSGSSSGNSVILGVYLSMATKNYAMWIDTLASDNQYSVPILESIDNLSTTADAYPNFYIIKGTSPQQSSVLAYTSKDGLWYFDAYSFTNQIQLTVAACTSSTIQFSTRGLAAEDVSAISTLRYYGEKVVEFTSGQVYSICRNIKSIALLGQTATISFSTPLAVLPQVGDTFVVFSRNHLSASLVTIPVASVDMIGGIKPGKNTEVGIDGSLNVVLDRETVTEALKPFNESESLLQLSKTGDEQISGISGEEFSGARVPERQLTYGALYFAGTWDAAANVVNGNDKQSLKSGGLFVITTDEVATTVSAQANQDTEEECPCDCEDCICNTKTEEPEPEPKPEEPVYKTKEWAPKGWIFQVTTAGSTELDGITDWQIGDFVVSDGTKWSYLNNRNMLLPMPDGYGFVVKNKDATTKTVQLGADDSGLQVIREGEGGKRMLYGLTETGVEAGQYGEFITVDKFGRISAVSDHLSAGTF